MKILTFPNNKLYKVSEDCDISDQAERERVSGLIKEMIPTMYEANGIGLSAPQVGENKRIFIIDVDQETEKDEDGEVLSRTPGKLLVFINPKIISKEGEKICEEGCLSVPGVYEEIRRAEKLTIEYYDENFEKKSMTAEGLLAVAIQHENDHLDGVLFIDKLPTVKRTVVKNRILKGKNL